MPPTLRTLLALVALALAAALVFPILRSSRHGQDIALLQAENELLHQENRLLVQQLEAERLQSAALVRRLQALGDGPRPTPPPVAPAPGSAPAHSLIPPDVETAAPALP